ncbi:hypothetical protein [Streptomyces sp. JJ36]|uniref:hypothetical protein n=1 Tax=Streptomyces sp. JJ36 TaxID=2736645 RepID=UPI001F28FD30|nr:hypothetical protein [Streptomyces sp. JJ36]MCF6522413.1 hypothetical protein [Streptomyces sp. JJ36]
MTAREQPGPDGTGASGPDGAPAPQEPALTAAQRRAVRDADPGTGAVHAAASTLRRLERLGLARAYGRVGAHYLTAAGRDLRDRLLRPPPGSAAPPPRAGFTPATGDGPPGDGPPGDGRADESAGGQHAAAAARAWEALLEIRRVTGESPERLPRPLGVPAPWERARPVHAVALALEAAGLPPSAVHPTGRRVRTGYRVTEGDTPGTARVEWRYAAGAAPDGDRTDDARRRLDTCAGVLGDRGWDTERYLGAARRPYLLAVPRRPGRSAAPGGR